MSTGEQRSKRLTSVMDITNTRLVRRLFYRLLSENSNVTSFYSTNMASTESIKASLNESRVERAQAGLVVQYGVLLH